MQHLVGYMLIDLRSTEAAPSDVYLRLDGAPAQKLWDPCLKNGEAKEALRVYGDGRSGQWTRLAACPDV